MNKILSHKRINGFFDFIGIDMEEIEGLVRNTLANGGSIECIEIPMIKVNTSAGILEFRFADTDTLRIVQIKN